MAGDKRRVRRTKEKIGQMKDGDGDNSGWESSYEEERRETEQKMKAYEKKILGYELIMKAYDRKFKTYEEKLKEKEEAGDTKDVLTYKDGKVYNEDGEFDIK